MAALLTGQGVSEIARQFGINKSTVSKMRSRIPHETLDQLKEQKVYDFGTQLAQYLDTALTTLKKQAEFFADEKWLEKQSASEAAVLHGVIADKTIRLLQAAEESKGAVGDGDE